MNDYIDLQEIAIHYLHNEQLTKYEQLTGLIARKENFAQIAMQTSFKILDKATRNIKNAIRESDIAFLIDRDSKGVYWKISYLLFAELHSTFIDEMNVLNAAECQEFEKDSVKLYWGSHLYAPLSQSLIEKCKTWVM